MVWIDGDWSYKKKRIEQKNYYSIRLQVVTSTMLVNFCERVYCIFIKKFIVYSPYFDFKCFILSLKNFAIWVQSYRNYSHAENPKSQLIS